MNGDMHEYRYSESNHRGFHRRWAELMSTDSRGDLTK
jgi:hypothetical protein